MMRFEAFQDKFLKENRPCWRLYSGKVEHVKKEIAKFPGDWTAFTKDSVPEGILNDSFVELEEEVNLYETDQYFFIKLHAYPKDNAPLCIQFFTGDPRHSRNRISGMHQKSDPEYILGIADKMSRERVEHAVAMAENNNKMANMQARMEALEEGTLQTQLLEGLIEKAPDLINAFLTKVKPGVAPVTQNPNGVNQVAGQADNQKIEAACNNLQQLYPQYQVDDLLERLALFCQHNKSTADTIVNQLIHEPG